MGKIVKIDKFRIGGLYCSNTNYVSVYTEKTYDWYRGGKNKLIKIDKGKLALYLGFKDGWHMFLYEEKVVNWRPDNASPWALDIWWDEVV